MLRFASRTCWNACVHVWMGRVPAGPWDGGCSAEQERRWDISIRWYLILSGEVLYASTSNLSVSGIFWGLATGSVQCTFDSERHVCLFSPSPLFPHTPFSSPWLALVASMSCAETHRVTHGVTSSTDTITKSPWHAINTSCSLRSHEI